MKNCMKLISSMNEEERKDYFERLRDAIGAAEKLNSTPYTEWTDEDHTDYEEIVWMLSAYSYARSFTKQDKHFKPEKRMGLVCMYLNAIVKKYKDEMALSEDSETRNGESGAKGNAMYGAEQDGKQGKEKTAVNTAGTATGKAMEAQPSTAGNSGAKSGGDDAEEQYKKAERLKMLLGRYEGARPKHFDEWEEFMSDELKKKASKADKMYIELGEARQLVEKLSQTNDTTEEERSQAAKAVAKIDNKIGNIYKLANKEWDELVKSAHE